MSVRVQVERDELQRRAAEQAAMLTQHGSQEKALEAAAQAARQDAARLRLDLQAAEHQHAQQLVSLGPGMGAWGFCTLACVLGSLFWGLCFLGWGAWSNGWPVDSVRWNAAGACACRMDSRGHLGTGSRSKVGSLGHLRLFRGLEAQSGCMGAAARDVAG